jgi:hypothetical protein
VNDRLRYVIRIKKIKRFTGGHGTFLSWK